MSIARIELLVRVTGDSAEVDETGTRAFEFPLRQIIASSAEETYGWDIIPIYAEITTVSPAYVIKAEGNDDDGERDERMLFLRTTGRVNLLLHGKRIPLDVLPGTNYGFFLWTGDDSQVPPQSPWTNIALDQVDTESARVTGFMLVVKPGAGVDGGSGSGD